MGWNVWCHAVALAALITAAVSGAAGVAVAAPGAMCLEEISQQEARRGIPAGLLAAVARAESGGSRYADAGQPWPWTLNVGGRGMFFASKAEALTAIETARREQPGTNIDVGCMQISLRHHGDAFDSLEDALDPVLNVRYAASFLASLQEKSGSWSDAAGRYHSGTPDLAAAYRERVFAFWKGTRPVTAPPGFVTVAGTDTRYNRSVIPNARIIRVAPAGVTVPPATGVPSRQNGGPRIIRLGE